MRKKPQYRFFVVFAAFLVVFLALGPAVAQAKGTFESRYFVYSKNSLIKSLFGAQHEFENGITADLTSGEVWTLEKFFKVKIEPVPLYEISVLPSDSTAANVLGDTLNFLPEKERVKEREKSPDSPVGWGVKLIYGGAAIKSTSGGKGVGVAILDSGANAKHLDLANRIKDCKDFTRGPFPRSACDDKNGHGTHLAGIIGASGGFDGNGIWGVASEADLLIYKVCRNDGTCWADDVAAGVDYARENGANIISLNLGGREDSSILKDSLARAVADSVLIVAAAGNNGSEKNTINWPAAYAKIVSVGAFGQDMNVPDWSGRGVNDGDYVLESREIELAAPGVNVQSTWNDGAYRYLSGTSVAAAHIAGLAAKIWDGSATSTHLRLREMASDIWTLGDDTATGLGLPILTRMPAR